MTPHSTTLADQASTTPNDCIRIVGARTHNLKNISLDIPRDQLVVITGRSGSGKSSLAFDTIHAEGQRQYMESMSLYSRQFMGSLPRPDVDLVEGLQPTLCLDQNFRNRNRRSTVGTITEIYHYLCLLLARVGRIHCHQCGNPIQQQTSQQIRDQLLKLPERTKLMILAPLVSSQKGSHDDTLRLIRRERLVRLRVDKTICDIDNVPNIDASKPHDIEAIADRIIVREGVEARLLEAIEHAVHLSNGTVIVCSLDPTAGSSDDAWQERVFSTRYACPGCDIHYAEISPRTFNFNSPLGACPECEGVGVQFAFDPEVVVADRTQTLDNGAIAAWRGTTTAFIKKQIKLLLPIMNLVELGPQQPLADLDETNWNTFLYSRTKQAPGLLAILERELATSKDDDRLDQLDLMQDQLQCHACLGSRVNAQARSVFLGDKDSAPNVDLNIEQIVHSPIAAAIDYFQSLKFEGDDQLIASPLVSAIIGRLGFLNQVGVGYLSLSRSADSLSGGEHQRVRLATSIGSGLTSVCFVLDEPSIGLHQRDNDRLIETIRSLQQAGNSVLVVEHDEAMILAADYVIDMGPGAGTLGGTVMFAGTPDEIVNDPASLTGQYLRGLKTVGPPAKRKLPESDRWTELTGACGNNLKSVAAKIPSGLFTCVTGVSGSGKSTLINDTLVPAVQRKLGLLAHRAGPHTELLLDPQIEKIIAVDQQPIGRSTRGCPATYVGLLDEFRKLFAATRQAKQLGFGIGKFSFNTKAGWCPECKGHGIRRFDMSFMPDLHAPCDLCSGRRFDHSVLQIRFADLTIAETLALTVDQALERFDGFERLRTRLQSLAETGLGYLPLDQSSVTLSGGELQRIKLAAELALPESGRTIYVLDEPTTGLHFDDIRQLLTVLQKIVDRGNTLIVIEHNLDVIRCADWIIDMGPDGGQGGGEVVTAGTPEQVATVERSWTGQYLREVLPK